MSSHTQHEAATLVERNIDLAFDFTQALIRDPSLLADVPHDATLVLIPDDEPDVAEANLTGAIEAFRTGRNVYLHHVRAGKI